MKSELEKKVREFPQLPGVYLMEDAGGEILYVGKASNLRARALSYFSKEARSRYQIRFLMSKVDRIQTMITDNEKEALLLENTLIKKHRPRYNIELKDDKSYVSLKLSIQHEAPRLYATRRIRKDGSLYYGPYVSAMACREVVEFIHSHFRLRTCNDHDYRNRVRPCLQYQIKRCDAPCVGYISLENYRKLIDQVRMFLEGRNDELKKMALQEMKRASEQENFELAARYRDLVGDMERTLERQKVVSHHRLNRDVLGMYREGEAVQLCLLMIREGSLQTTRHFFFKSYEHESDLISSFLSQYYEAGKFIPKEILIPCDLEGKKPLKEILSERAGHVVNLLFPQRGEKISLIRMAGQNARQAFASRTQKAKDLQSTLEELQRKLRLKKLPRRIECYDISNFQGTESVGSMISFVDGQPFREGYRHFKIKSVQGANDFASIYEVMARRVRRNRPGVAKEEGDSWSLPDLMVIDGGKGQLNAAAQALKDFGITDVDLVALAKSRPLAESDPRRELTKAARSEERVFLKSVKDPIFFPPHSSALFLLVKVRDEAHRFGIEYHRKRRERRTLVSGLDQIEGVGKVRRQKLLKHFGSLKRIKLASSQEVAEVLGGSLPLAERIQQSL